MEKSKRPAVSTLADIMHKKICEALIIHVITLFSIACVPFIMDVPTKYDPEKEYWFVSFIFTTEYIQMFPSDKIFFGVWTAIAYCDMVVIVLTMRYLLLSIARMRYKPEIFRWAYGPYWFHLFTLFYGGLLTLFNCFWPVWEDYCYNLSPLFLILAPLTILHMIAAKIRTVQIKKIFLSPQVNSKD